MEKAPLARGRILVAGDDPALAALQKEAASILRAIDGPADAETLAEADYVLALVQVGVDAAGLEVPDLKDRAGSVIGLGGDAADARAAVLAARKHLRARGATLTHRELVFSPAQFGYLGLESDGARERLEILLRGLIVDAEALRLKREGWEEPETRETV